MAESEKPVKQPKEEKPEAKPEKSNTEQAKSEVQPEAKKEKKPQREEVEVILRIAGVDLDGFKRLKRGLRKIKGINHQMANAIVKLAGFGDKKIGILTPAEVSKIEEIIENPLKNGVPGWMLNRRKDYETGDDIHISGVQITSYKRNDLNRLQKTKSYRGLRHAAGLKVRGQRTRSTGRGSATLGVVRKKV
ncbi:30S ribosomal protein S13 [Candidatus Undinarchaeota archaeon]